MKINRQFVALGFAAALGQLTGCSKVNITLEKPKPAESASSVISPVVPQPPIATASSPGQHTAAERIAEIDGLLSAPLTGNPEDSDHRATLRAERAALIGSYQGFRSNVVNPAPVQANQAAPAPNGNIIIARDSNGEQGYLPGLEGMIPSERARYLKFIRATRPAIVIERH